VLTLDPDWYAAIAVRRSRRRYTSREVAQETLQALRSFCDTSQLAPGVRVALVEDHATIYKGIAGAYGRVDGAPWSAVFVAPQGAETEAGYLGEAFVLEATNLGLGTCWVAGTLRRAALAEVVDLTPGEHVVAVTPLGYPEPRKQLAERVMSAAVHSTARRQLENIAPNLHRDRSPDAPPWPSWAIAAVEAARLAPSGANRQPWRFRLQGETLIMGSAANAGWTAPIDFGIAMLHAELGAAHTGVCGGWQRLEPPDVACFVPLPAGKRYSKAHLYGDG